MKQQDISEETTIENLLFGGGSTFAIETHEEARAKKIVKLIAGRRNYRVSFWSVSSGLDGSADSKDPVKALSTIPKTPGPRMTILFDIHPFFQNPEVVRLIKELTAAPPDEQIVVMVGHSVPLPVELEKLVTKYEMPLPSKDDILVIIKEEVANWQRKNGKELVGDKQSFDIIVKHLSGLTEPDIRKLVRVAISGDGTISSADIRPVINKKHELLSSDGALSLETDVAKLADVAGFAKLKEWLQFRKNAFLEDIGLDSPKGIMLLGVQGCGKSLAAKSVAGAWEIPLMRLDFGTLYNKYLGETERNLRESLKAADAMEPCILWIDEIEKGITTGNSDNGESKRILGTLLTWMAERKSKVFVIATSNDIQSLPPELIRKGRLDEIFFVDLPTDEERLDVFRIHLKRRGFDNDISLSAAVEATAGFSGAEIEQVVVSAAYRIRTENSPMSETILADIAKSTNPLSVTAAEKIAWLRMWASERAVSVSGNDGNGDKKSV